jgi:predicted Na+-dependent transporter
MIRNLEVRETSRSILQAFAQAPTLLINGIQDGWRTSVELIEELVNHRFFQSLHEVDWSQYQLGPILIASVLINLLELASPLYINIVYTSVLPSGSMSSLVVTTVAAGYYGNAVIGGVVGDFFFALSLAGTFGPPQEER